MTVAIATLSEDRSKHAQAVLEWLVRAAARAGGAPAGLAFEAPDAATSRLMHGSMWKSHRNSGLLARWIGTRIREGAVVVFHFDADVAWPKMAAYLAAFEKLERAVGHLTDATLLVSAVPYTEIEGWTFRNTATASKLSANHAAHARCAEDPSLLETTLGLKDLSPLGSAHNLDLVQKGWPYEAAYADGRSFRAFAEALRTALQVKSTPLED